ncbi:MAG: hypothetical protein U0R51_14630 [Solirubrobacterales bacterium]
MKISPLASSSVGVHIARGVGGLVALVAAVLGTAVVGPPALLLLLAAAFAWRGCPTCWAVGLMHTREGAACRVSREASNLTRLRAR